MAVRTRVRGEGFSAREELVLFSGPPEDWADTIAEHNAQRLWTLDAELRRIEDAARSILGEDHPGGEDSSPDYAERALRLIHVIRAEASSGCAERSALAALRLGSLVREHDLKIEHEAAARTGAPIRRGLTESRERANLERQAERRREHAAWQIAADAFWERDGQRSKNEVARNVKSALALPDSISTIAQRIKKPPKAK